MALPITYWHIASPDEPTASLVLPPKLYYVRHGHSQADPAADGGFSPANPNHNISTEEDLKKHATDHFNWYNWDYSSCFISVFGCRKHAKNWAICARSRRKPPIVIYELDTAKLPPGTLVLNAYMLCAHLDIKHFNSGAGTEDEFLFYKGIPGCCITKSWDPFTAPSLSVNYNIDLNCADEAILEQNIDYQITWDSVIERAERLQDRYKGQLADTNRDADVNNLAGKMGALDLQRDASTKANSNTASANALRNVATPATASSSTGAVVAPRVRNPTVAATITKEQGKKQELWESQELQKVAESGTNASILRQLGFPDLPRSDMAHTVVQMDELLDLKGAPNVDTRLSTSSDTPTDLKPDNDTKPETDSTVAPETTPGATAPDPRTGDPYFEVAASFQAAYDKTKREAEQLLQDFVDQYNRIKKEAEMILIQRERVLDSMADDPGSPEIEYEEW